MCVCIKCFYYIYIKNKLFLFITQKFKSYLSFQLKKIGQRGGFQM